MLGQRASWQTVWRFSDETSWLTRLYSSLVWRRILNHSGRCGRSLGSVDMSNRLRPHLAVEHVAEVSDDTFTHGVHGHRRRHLGFHRCHHTAGYTARVHELSLIHISEPTRL